jgi:CheY-like chemotaxis protein
MATRLLLADDSITIQKVVELVLAEEGFEIKPTSNGEEAFQALDSFRPEIVLADIEMPRMNGYQLCEKIRKKPGTANVPVILLAGAFEPVDEELARKVGATDFIIKPFESQDLVSKINSALSGKPAKEEAREEAVPEEETPVVSEALEEEAFAVAEAETDAGPGEDLWAEDAFGGTALSMEDAGTGEEVEVLAEEDAFAMEEPTPEPVSFKEPPASSWEAPISAGDLTDAVKISVSRVVVDSMKKVDMREVILSAIGPELKRTIEDLVREAAPKIMESLVREVMKEVSAGVKKDMEKIIWETVPDLAESIIKKEIEAIKSEI